jgi:transcriptional regulator with XRE-family HTH domain
VDRGLARGRALVARLVGEIVEARRNAGLSQQTLSQLVGCSQSEISRLEHLQRRDEVAMVRLAQVAAVMGLDLSAGLHPVGEAIRDKGHQLLIARFVRQLSPTWRVAREVPLPNVGDPRAWDLVLRMDGCVVGIEAETRVRDIQALARRMHVRQRDGGTMAVLLTLAESAHNRRVLPELVEALGSEFGTSSRATLRALREGRPVTGSGVLML